MARDPGFTAAQEKVARHIEAIAELIGPRDCIHGAYDECESDCEYTDTKPVPGMMTDMVLLSNWTRMEDGENTISVFTPPNQLASHTDGLLYTVLTKYENVG